MICLKPGGKMHQLYFQKCADITEDDFRWAVESDKNTRIFLQRLQGVTTPNTPAGRILHFFARLALKNQTASFAYEDLALQVIENSEKKDRFDIRYMYNVGGVYELIYKVTVNCTFNELLDGANDKANMQPFSSVDAYENYLLMEASAENRKISLPPAAYQDADARYQELERAGMLQYPNPPPLDQDMEDFYGSELPLCDRLMEAMAAGKPLSSLVTNEPVKKMSKPPVELQTATVNAGTLLEVRKEFDSGADEAEYLTSREPSLPNEPVQGAPDYQGGISSMIGRITLARVPARQANQKNYLRTRPETERPPGINADAGEVSIPPLPLVFAETDKKDEDEAVDEGWNNIHDGKKNDL